MCSQWGCDCNAGSLTMEAIASERMRIPRGWYEHESCVHGRLGLVGGLAEQNQRIDRQKHHSQYVTQSSTAVQVRCIKHGSSQGSSFGLHTSVL